MWQKKCDLEELSLKSLKLELHAAIFLHEARNAYREFALLAVLGGIEVIVALVGLLYAHFGERSALNLKRARWAPGIGKAP